MQDVPPDDPCLIDSTQSWQSWQIMYTNEGCEHGSFKCSFMLDQNKNFAAAKAQ